MVFSPHVSCDCRPDLKTYVHTESPHVNVLAALLQLPKNWKQPDVLWYAELMTCGPYISWNVIL